MSALFRPRKDASQAEIMHIFSNCPDNCDQEEPPLGSSISVPISALASMLSFIQGCQLVSITMVFFCNVGICLLGVGQTANLLLLSCKIDIRWPQFSITIHLGWTHRNDFQSTRLQITHISTSFQVSMAILMIAYFNRSR